ncbi:hypothetical protein GGR51DRAFT_54739 [Nemania sp. FL0031]|nr:hypothetical protein GGR51DRAFT_54739 [Nemania sp. FL0031]
MASELTRPPTRTASGSRPPTSRFQEGSMNDRISAAPPAQFLGPEQLKDYETQFYQEPPTLPEARRPRPFSASAVHRVELQEPVPLQQSQSQQQYQHPHHHNHQQQQQRTVAHKKSSGFFGRVRDALFHRGGGHHHGEAASKQQEVRRKHSSLQEPLREAYAAMSPPPPRPDYLQAGGRTQSEINIAQMFPANPRGGTDRPSREDVMASYNQLVASGFFQSHAIQSTRHAAPGASAMGGRQTPIDNQVGPPPPRPQKRLSSINASPRAGSVSPLPPALAPAGKMMTSPSSNPRSQSAQEYYAAPPTMPAAIPSRSSFSSLFRPSIPDLHTSDSRISLRGRKRARGDGDESSATSAEGASSSIGGATSYFSQPLRRVAKKLREMPSATFQSSKETSSSNHNGNNNNNAVSASARQPSHHMAAAADGIVQLTPSVTSGGSLYPNERPVRLRSPSPAAPEVTATGHNEWKSEAPLHSERAMRARRPRRTFSYTLTESVRGRTRTIERECERERERGHGTNRLQRRGSSAGRSESKSRAAYNRRTQTQTQTPTKTQTQNPLGVWQRVSLEDTIIHRDSIDSTRSPPRDRNREHQHQQDQRRERTVLSKSPNPSSKTRKPAQSPSPLRALPDANRGSRGATPTATSTSTSTSTPSIPKAPERWHGTGKAYHLKDRGSRPDLTVRQSVDSGKADVDMGMNMNVSTNINVKVDYGKENNNNWHAHHDAAVDSDGDIDLLAYETRRQLQQKQFYQQPQHQWRIGNAL